MNSELIERLKDNKIHAIFDDLKPEANACLREVGFENCEWLTCSGDGDGLLWMQTEEGSFLPHLCYRIQANYQPKQEYVDLPVVSDMQWLGVKIPNRLPYPFVHLHCLPSLPYFANFCTPSGEYVNLADVATFMSEDKDILVRFRRDN